MSAPIASSLDRALSLLFAFVSPDTAQRVFTVSALAEQLDMDKAQVSRALATFAKYGLVERLEKRRGYQLGWAVVPLASRALTAQTMSRLYPELTKLSVDLGETVHFTVRDAASSVCLAAFEPDRRIFVQQREGHRSSLLGSAVGYALLAQSTAEEIRVLYDAEKPKARIGLGGWRSVAAATLTAETRGYSLVRNEQGEGVTTIAGLIHDVGNYRGRVYATVGLSAPDERFAAQEETIVERVMAVVETANVTLQAREQAGPRLG